MVIYKFRGKIMKKGWKQRGAARRKGKTKLDILKQSREREPMPRPAVFRDRKKYNRNLLKDMDRKERE